MFNVTADEFRDQLSGLESGCAAIDAAIDLRLLNAIEETTDALTIIEKSALSLTKAIRASESAVKRVKNSVAIDVNGKFADIFEERANELADTSSDFRAKRACIDTADELKPHAGHREHLHLCYEMLLEAVALLREAVLDLRAAIITHDLNTDKGDGTSFTNATDLIKALRSAA